MPHRIEMVELCDRWEGYWADIRKRRGFPTQARIDKASEPGLRITAGELDRLRGAAGSADGIDEEGTPLGLEGGHPLTAAIAIIGESVVTWNLPIIDDEGLPTGKTLPLGRAGVMHDGSDIDMLEQLVDAIEDYYKAQRIPVSELKASAPA